MKVTHVLKNLLPPCHCGIEQPRVRNLKAQLKGTSTSGTAAVSQVEFPARRTRTRHKSSNKSIRMPTRAVHPRESHPCLFTKTFTKRILYHFRFI
jgi:hypothetical protein